MSANGIDVSRNWDNSNVSCNQIVRNDTMGKKFPMKSRERETQRGRGRRKEMASHVVGLQPILMRSAQLNVSYLF